MGQKLKEIYALVKEIDEYIGCNAVTDWEMSFISDMMDKVAGGESFSQKQIEHIQRIWEKYCA